MDIHVCYKTLAQAITTQVSLNDLYYKALLHNIYKYKYVRNHREQRVLLYFFCKCVEDNKHRFTNKVWMNRIHKCKIVDILT